MEGQKRQMDGQTDIHKDKQTNYLKDGGQPYETNQLGQKTDRQINKHKQGAST
jgi:hypothetical protein